MTEVTTRSAMRFFDFTCFLLLARGATHPTYIWLRRLCRECLAARNRKTWALNFEHVRLKKNVVSARTHVLCELLPVLLCHVDKLISRFLPVLAQSTARDLNLVCSEHGRCQRTINAESFMRAAGGECSIISPSLHLSLISLSLSPPLSLSLKK